MAQNKMQQWSWLLRHVAVYMVLPTAVVIFYALSHKLPAWLIVATLFFLAATHIILDQRRFTLWWMRLVGVSPDHPWLSIVVDQVFHLLTMAVVAQILVLSSR